MKQIFYSLLSVALLAGFGSCGTSAPVDAAADSSEVSVMCFNIRYANPQDGPFVWENRREAIVTMLKDVSPDVLGIQEGLAPQVAYLDSALTGYSYVGVGRDDGKQAGEYAAIFYKDSLYTPLASGNFWLSETPDSASLGWDAACIRIATWAKLQEKATGKAFVCINTHFDHIGPVARRSSAELLMSRLEQIADTLPVVITGDFNSPVEDPALAALVNSPLLQEVRAVAAHDSLPPVTYTSFHGEEAGALIDHIFSGRFTPVHYDVITETYGVPKLSDHMPVVGTLKY